MLSSWVLGFSAMESCSNARISLLIRTLMTDYRSWFLTRSPGFPQAIDSMKCHTAAISLYPAPALQTQRTLPATAPPTPLIPQQRPKQSTASPSAPLSNSFLLLQSPLQLLLPSTTPPSKISSYNPRRWRALRWIEEPILPASSYRILIGTPTLMSPLFPLLFLACGRCTYAQLILFRVWSSPTIVFHFSPSSSFHTLITCSQW